VIIITARIICIEGSDGIGKATQTKKLVEHLREDGYKVATMSFPRYETPTGKKILDYLQGKFGDPIKIDPLKAGYFYYEDRKAALPEMKELMEKNDFLILDRYKYSNFAHQSAKIIDEDERKEILEKLQDMERDLPEADLVILLIVKPEISQKLLEKEKKKDLHESDVEFMKRTNKVYEYLCEENENWIKINCMRNGKLMGVDEIHRMIYNVVKEFFKL